MSQVTDAEWSEYKTKFEKSYDGEEDQMRRAIFAKSKAKIEEHNKKYDNGEVTWKMGINHLADLTEEEFGSRCGARQPQ
ncbi:protein CTLA-2-alpha [Drosophila innubila]|uniref:protein CTLA-2-alpha n=1 Tax=Drosophila innubila TaxID=198719 RepID=UPI00148D124A|nr:protein CTLA-2-alpha [Drosophila innubila]